jgi:glycosyltransferase involved in cell wall biosynthesis
MATSHLLQYVVITPVKNEEKFLRATITSMVAQVRLPMCWIIVDDASTDTTALIAKEAEGKYPFIRYLKFDGAKERLTGSAEVRAFNAGLQSIARMTFDVIVKLDGDLEFGSEYFKELMEHLDKNERLGIVSGMYLEEKNASWKPVSMPYYHAAGASKVIRYACYKDIGGFITQRGWDTVDEIRAWFKGWKTEHVPQITFYHLRPEGIGMGMIRTNSMHGEIFYRTGGGFLLMLIKSTIRMFKGRPFILAGKAMAWGYLLAAIRGMELLVTKDEAKLYKKMLTKRFWRIFKIGSGT